MVKITIKIVDFFAILAVLTSVLLIISDEGFEIRLISIIVLLLIIFFYPIFECSKCNKRIMLWGSQYNILHEYFCKQCWKKRTPEQSEHEKYLYMMRNNR